MAKHPLKHLSAANRAKFHIFMSYVWIVTMVAIPFFPTFRNWSDPATLAALLIMEVSLYANFATEFGSVDAAKASEQTHEESERK